MVILIQCNDSFLGGADFAPPIFQRCTPDKQTIGCKKPQGFLGSAAVRRSNLRSVFEGHDNLLFAVNRHILDRVTPQSLIELGDECVQFPHPTDEVLDLKMPTPLYLPLLFFRRIISA